MKSWGVTCSIALLAALAIVVWQRHSRLQPAAAAPAAGAFATAPHGRAAMLPLPPAPVLPAEKVTLGKRLFFDKRLSTDDSLACAGCHDFTRGGADRAMAATGVGGKRGTINTPTVFNASLNFVQFWDGRAATLEEQAAGPVHNPLEMASNWEEVIAKLSRDIEYVKAFNQIYNGMTGAAIVDAIATFERSLLTPDSRFDRYLRGDKQALNERELEGYNQFLNYGCAACHQGVLLGGNMFQRFGIMDDYFSHLPASQSIPGDLGRFNVTNRKEDRHVFKVPSLRNVAVTAPYFHNGSAATLEEAVVTMGRYQLGRELSTTDIETITAFLRTLTGEWEGQPLR